MPQHLKVQLTITLDGIDANEVLDVLAQSAIDGELDQAILNLVRAHLAPWQPALDWRVVSAAVTEGATE